MATRSQTGMWITVIGCMAGLAAGGCGSPVDRAGARQFESDLGHTGVTMFPTVIRTTALEYDEAAAAALGDFVERRNYAEVRVVGDQVPMTGDWSRNQMRMWRSSAASFCEHVRSNPPDTPYAMLAEYLGVSERGVGGIHLYVVRVDGTLVGGLHLNSHHAVFREVDPRSVADCTEVLKRAMEQYWPPVTAEPRSAGQPPARGDLP